MEWISVKDGLPRIKDDSVFVFFDHGGIDIVHIMDYFVDITSGFDDDGKQLYAKWFQTQGVTHWMPLPDPPAED